MLTYPPSPRTDLIEHLHGVPVADPYRWLEDIDSPQTRQWIQAQNELAFGYLEQIPAREQIRQRITELWSLKSLASLGKVLEIE